MIRLGVLVATMVAIAALPGYADAAARWAAPRGGGTACTQAVPCSLVEAADNATPSDSVYIRGDRGAYRLQASLATNAGEILGVFGRPRLLFSAPATSGLDTLVSASVVNLFMQAPDKPLSLTHGGFARDVVAVTSGASATSCSVRYASLTNVVCWATGTDSVALDERAESDDHVTYVRYTTALASGSNGVAVLVRAANGHTGIVHLSNVIARGGPAPNGVDLQTITDGAPSSSAQITASYSNFATHDAGGNGAQDPVPDFTDQVAAPLFVDAAHGDFHQACGSPTIDRGAEVEGLPATDFERDPRILGRAIDIGADEFVPGPVAVTQQASRITPTSATFTGAVNPRGCAVTYHFEYGPTTSYGRRTPDRTLPKGSSPRPVSARVDSLARATRYHFRLVATSASGIARAPDRAFATEDTFARMKIGSKTARARRGRVRVRVGCPAGAASKCTGKLTLSTADKVKLRKGSPRRVLALGHKHFAIRAGRTAGVTVKLSHAGRTLLKKQRTLKTRARAVATDAFGKRGTANRKLTLKRPR